jgi:hypothetical protein
MAEDLEREDFDFGDEEPTPPEESSNRTFLIVAGILGGITVLALVCIAVYAFVILPGQRRQTQGQIATLTQQYLEVEQALTQTALAQAFTATFTPSRPAPTNTVQPNTPTPVVAVPTETVAATSDPRTATMAALMTQAALAASITPSPTSALPNTGFIDDFGIPGLFSLAALLILVIFLARRLRTA